ncbi:hypothetical protein A3709_19090 [Halioglobus sp. HI00S01]|uniref:CCA tRNA nucleotidyltransferase n=1 Tax=Halioglobus sp. HI00S01 TaxID=1822214 RepID=UPI0007C37572|nr:HD domain-containing protein [Halioglobus sp. HI00S01]KZX57731.1 hypothetical protein A3709_19090 [Halioglobus sp. HI00S01]
MNTNYDRAILEFAASVKSEGGRALLVGGMVRDELLGLASKDVDMEVFGISPDTLCRCLEQFGRVKEVGQQFGVYIVEGLDWDVALPRRELKTGAGHRGFDVQPEPSMTVEQACRRRDFTINAIARDPLTGEIIDPLQGQRDIERRLLVACDATTFGDDPLRALRAAQFASRFDFDVDEGTLRIIADQPLDELPGERVYAEFQKLLLKGAKPSSGFEVLDRSGLLHFFPEVAAMQGVPQDAKHHPEGPVFEHVMMVIDEAAKLRTGNQDEDMALMLGALCHDLGKPAFTQIDGDRIKSHGHEKGGVEPTREFLRRIKAPNTTVKMVCALVEHHLKPQTFAGVAGRKGYRNLARELSAAGVSPALLARLSTADCLGRTTPAALARDTTRQQRFLDEMALHVGPDNDKPLDSVSGKDLIKRGFEPGPEMGEMLRLIRDIEDQTGITDADRLITKALEDADSLSAAARMRFSDALKARGDDLAATSEAVASPKVAP